MWSGRVSSCEVNWEVWKLDNAYLWYMGYVGGVGWGELGGRE